MILFIFGMSNFVWNIEVTGNNTISKEEIMTEVSNSGLKLGILKQKIDTKNIINNLRLKRDDIAWVRNTP